MGQLPPSTTTWAPYGLHDLFNTCAISEAVGVSKPNGAIFYHVLQQLDVGLADCGHVIVVGNCLGRDVKGGQPTGHHQCLKCFAGF